MAEEDQYKILVFYGTNFSNWKFRMEMVLNERDLLSFVQQEYTSTVTFEETDTAEVRTETKNRLVAFQKKDRKCKPQIV